MPDLPPSDVDREARAAAEQTERIRQAQQAVKEKVWQAVAAVKVPTKLSELNGSVLFADRDK